MQRLSRDKRIAVLAQLCEGSSIASTTRITSVSKPAILRLLLAVSRACLTHEDAALRNLNCTRIECDELWGFCFAKEGNLRPELVGKTGVGSIWTWLGFDPDSKLIVSWITGKRDQTHANALMVDLASRVSGRIQVTTDGLHAYEEAIDKAFRETEVDYGRIVKEYGRATADESRYSPPQCLSCKKSVVMGDPEWSNISTSLVERQNLNIRMGQRRWTRLTNAHSKKFEYMEAAFALFACHYNWVRRHMGLKDRATPAMAAGLADRPWTMGNIVDLLEAQERTDIAAGKLKRGPYGKRNRDIQS